MMNFRKQDPANLYPFYVLSLVNLDLNALGLVFNHLHIRANPVFRNSGGFSWVII